MLLVVVIVYVKWMVFPVELRWKWNTWIRQGIGN